MKKRSFLFTLIVMTLLVGCKPTPSSSETSVGELSYEVYDDTRHKARVDNDGYTIIDFYALNDFHGAIEERNDEGTAALPGIGKLNTFLKTRRNDNPGGTILLANGDMWQGSADSNITRGETVTHLLNHMGFAALTLGNHEFDWSIDVIRQNKAISNFPYLGANIIEKGTTNVVDFVDESPLLERDGVKIGVIGTMGSSLETTVQPNLISNIEFDVTTDYVVNEAARLRDLGANIVVLATHDSWFGNLKEEQSAILGADVVDAIFTGHQHVLHNEPGLNVPILQARAYGRDVQYVSLGYNKVTEDVKLIEYDVVENISEMNLAKDETSEMIANYFYEKFNIDAIKNEVLGSLINREMNRGAVARFAINVLTDAFSDQGVVGAMHNVNGGIRATIELGPILYKHIYNAFPFDNEVYLVELQGRRIKNLTAASNIQYYWGVDRATLDDFATYYVATTNFVYELIFIDEPPFVNTFEFPRDIIADHIRAVQTIDGNLYRG